MERRHSTASDTSTDSRQSSNEGLETGRISKTMAPKVAVNPLQFVKVGPCDLYRSAQEQLKKVEEIKKAKREHKDETEDWQSNLDHWKCSRRKRQEHIIERVVEVKKLELEEHERNRRRSKTFSEMMQERNTRGRKTSLPVWDDNSDDLSDLGINSKNNSSADGDRLSEVNGDSEQNSRILTDMNFESEKGSMEENQEKKNCLERSQSSTESEEFTYERAIQSYVNFAETRVKSRSSKSIDEDPKEAVKEKPLVPIKPKRGSVTKIDTYISQIELSKNKSSGESNDATKKPIALPKVDVNKRKALFENTKESEELKKQNKTADVPASKSIKERLSSLEKQGSIDSSCPNINTANNNRTALKERLLLKKKLSSSTTSVSRRLSEIPSSQSIKERLSNFEQSKASPPKTQNIVEPTVSIKERLNSLHSSFEKESSKTVNPSVNPTFNDKLSNFKDESPTSDSYNSRAYSPDEIYSKREQHFRHRSLDSLDINQENMSNGSFERVQSLEDLDYRNYPASTFSGDTDREDSGIHTADVSSSVSQADDYDLHLDGNILDDIKLNHQPPIEEETKLLKTDLCHDEPLKSVSDEDSLVAKSLTPDSSFSETLPPIIENPNEPLTYFSHLVEEPIVNSSPSPISSCSSHCNNVKALDTVCEPHASHIIEMSHNNNFLNKSKSITEYNPDEEIKPSGFSLTGDGGLVEEKSFQSVSSDAEISNQFVSLQASHSKVTEETRNLILQERQNALLTQSEPVPKIKEEVITSVTNNAIQPSSPLNEIPQFKVEQLGNNFLSYENLHIDINVPIVNQLTEVIVENEPKCLFPLSPAVLEPPKEKPPPPPVEKSDDETEKIAPKAKSLRRLDSTKRIKKELRQKRSSFLGIEGNDDNYLEPELELIRPPDMITLLAEERRVERQLYRQSVCSESDSNQESRDSGVELDHKHNDVWSHSRNDSETFGNHSTTSDEDEIMKKEREIIETLEQEEKIRKQDLGEKLAMRLRELEVEKERWGQLQAQTTRNTQAHTFPKHNHASADNLDKCQSHDGLDVDWFTPSSSLQDISHLEPPILDYRGDYRKSMGDLSVHQHQGHVRYAGHRRSMPNLEEVVSRRPPPPPPPPVLLMKPLQHPHDTLPGGVPHHSQHATQQRIMHPQLPSQPSIGTSGQMSKQTLQALSAAPRSRLLSGDSWQVRKKQQRPESYNYQHWLIQEAEQRRITEQQERTAMRRPEVGRQGSWPVISGHVGSQQQTASTTTGHHWGQPSKGKHLPDAIIQTLTQRVQSRLSDPNQIRRRQDMPQPEIPYPQMTPNDSVKEKMLSVSGKKRCSHCGEELGRGAAMIIESLQLFYHIDCFKCCVCCIQLGDGLNGTDVRVRNNKLHCHNCYSSDDGAKFSCV